MFEFWDYGCAVFDLSQGLIEQFLKLVWRTDMVLLYVQGFECVQLWHALIWWDRRI
jgi:hypothetical protein